MRASTAAASIALALLQAGAPGARTGPAGERDFPVFVWHHAGDEPDAGVLRSFGGTQIVGAEDAAWARELGLEWLVFNAAGREALHIDRDAPRERRRWQEWYETRDPRLAVREPCLADPATRESLLARLAQSLAARGGEHGFGVSLGDEVSWTPAGGPEDLCSCEHCRAAWTSWLAAREELTERERAELAELVAISTDATRLALGEGRSEALGGWLLRRRFHQEQLLGVLEELACETRRCAPTTPVGLLGMAGQSAFGGVALERALPWLDFAECYRTGNARELLFTLRGRRQRALLTLFVDARFPDHAAWQAWEHYLRGGDGLVLWSERALARSAETTERLASAVREIRAVRLRAPGFGPAPAGVAVVHSADALAGAWLRDALLDGPTWPNRRQGWQEEHGTLESALRGWLRLFEDCGVQPGALPLASVGSASVQRFPLLVLNHLGVLDERDLGRLREHVVLGGRVLVHGELGALDSRGRRRERAALEQLREAAPERVEFVGEDLASYALARTRGGPAAEGWRGRASKWLDVARVERPPWTWRGEARERLWLCAWSRDLETGAILCAALPSEGDAAFAPERLRPAALALEPPEGFALEWIHPARAEANAGEPQLAAGDAAVFRLVPRE